MQMAVSVFFLCGTLFSIAEKFTNQIMKICKKFTTNFPREMELINGTNDCMGRKK
jgi:hypothetical protein